MKIDTQGSELSILQGAANYIQNNIFGIETEVAFVSIYNNQPLFSDVDVFLRSYGYQLFDLRRSFWKREIGLETKGEKGQLIFGDALYLRTYDSYRASLLNNNFNIEEKKAKILKGLAICLLYGLYDYAIWLCNEAANDDLLTSYEKEKIIKILKKGKKGITFKGETVAKYFANFA